MKAEWIIPPPGSPEAVVRLELTESELRALIHRCVPEDTWMKGQSNQLIRKHFPGGFTAASDLADDLTMGLIRTHDRRYDGRWLPTAGAFVQDPEASDG